MLLPKQPDMKILCFKLSVVVLLGQKILSSHCQSAPGLGWVGEYTCIGEKSGARF